jgi:flagellar biogenesis protein FliO
LGRPFHRTFAAAAAFAALAGPAAAQRLGAATSVDVPWLRVIGALVLCLGLAVAAAFALRSRLKGGVPSLLAKTPRRLQLVENLRLSHQVDLCLVVCDERRMLVASSPHGAVLLARLDGGVEADAP